MRKIEPEIITGMGYIGDNPGVVYRMGGAGEQTVVTGNPALLEGVKGSRFTSLTLRGKSTQGSTTGAQLANLPDTNATIFNGITWECKNGIITANGTTTTTSSSIGAGINATLKLPAGDYYISGKNKNIEVYISIKKEDGSTEYYNSSFSVNGETTVTVFAQIYKTGVTVNNEKVYIMLNAGSTALPWEPYTGGAPSPSPSYPQEIESAGQSGEIGVTVTGTNLLPFEVGQKGDGFEAFADGVQVDVGRNVDIYAVGANDSLIESGYSEFPLLAPGKYYIYSDIQGVNLYVVVWRKGANVTLGYSRGGVAKEIEVMAGDKFRIFLRTAAAFKGKVKAMITRIPVDATSYEPYKPAQNIIIPTPGGLPGIPVTAGGNYTDKDGQQWGCDEIDLAMGEMVQQTIKVVLDGSQKITLQKHLDFNRFAIGENDFPIPSGYAGFCSHFIVNPSPVTMNTIDGAICVYSNGNIYLRSDRFKSADELKSFLKENPVTLEYCLAEPIRTPLPPETIAAYKKLHTYSPTTTVINDAGAGMIVGYKRRK